MGAASADAGPGTLLVGADNEWNASDQIPTRLVAASGSFDRFSQVDSTLGGAMSRYSLSARWTRAGVAGSQRLDLYAIRYDLDLYSNFTYFLDDPEPGDQIQQEGDGRSTFGIDFAHVQPIGADRVHTLTSGSRAGSIWRTWR